MKKKQLVLILLCIVLLLPSLIFISYFKTNLEVTPQILSSQKQLYVDVQPMAELSSPETVINSDALLEANLVSFCLDNNGNVIEISDPDNILALVDKFHKLPDAFIPQDLVWIKDYKPQTVAYGKIRKLVLPNLLELLRDLKAAGLRVEISSGFRDYYSQGRIYAKWVAKAGPEAAQFYAARPGFSEHQLGTAVDINPIASKNKKQNYQNQQGVYSWLIQNSYKYGFLLSYPKSLENLTGYNYEPWHYRFVGKESAKEIFYSGMSLIEFLYRKNGICL